MMRNTITPLKGGIIELWTHEKMAQEKTWEKVIGEMQELKMDTVVIQYMDITSGDGSEHNFLPSDSNGNISPASLILDEANKHNMKVFLGLYNNVPLSGNTEITGKDCLECLDEIRMRDIQLAETLMKLYKDQPSFYGWYIPTESWTGKYKKADRALWNNFYKKSSRFLKKLSPKKKILISPFISKDSTRSKPSQTEKIYREIFAGTKIDFVALQDGVGAGATSVNSQKVIRQHFKYMKRACQANGIQLWGNIESFRIPSPNVEVPACLPDTS